MRSYSKSTEDQVICGLIDHLKLKDHLVCVDIGARSLEGSNIARLVFHEKWEATLIERSPLRVANLKQHFSGYPINVVKQNVTTKNINKILPPIFRLLNIDIDGQDYYIWQAIDHKADIVVIEYNPHMSGEYVMPLIEKYNWKLDLDRMRRGASKDSMVGLGKIMGYSLAEYNGDNLFFIKDKD